VPVKNEKPENGPTRAWLWIPPNCEYIHGVVVARYNMEGISILENPIFRKAQPDWAQLPTNTPLGHAGSGAILVDSIAGPIKKISADTFAFYLKRETLLTTNAKSYELVFAATHPSDAEYKSAVQLAHIYVPAQNTQGAEQQITFPGIPDQKAGTKSLKLKATADANIPVHYFIREGPAEIDGDTQTLTKIPPRAKFPVKVTVVTWQYGLSVEPKLKTAEPVGRTFYIVKLPQAIF
jgi:hypothetical protein